MKKPASVLCPLGFPVAGFAAGLGNAFPFAPAPILELDPFMDAAEPPMEGLRSSVSVTLEARESVVAAVADFRPALPWAAGSSSASPSEQDTSSVIVLVT